MPLDDLHRQVATIGLAAARQHGFALGGGNALIAHGLISRPTEDVDIFTTAENVVPAAADAIEEALRAAGFVVTREDKTSDLADLFEGFELDSAEMLVTAVDGRTMRLQLARIDRCHQPVTMDVGPVVHIDDAVGSKVCALAGRHMPRDFIDVAAALSRYTVAELIDLARRIDPGLADEDFADAGRRLDRINDQAFMRYGLTPADVAELRARMAAWPRP